MEGTGMAFLLFVNELSRLQHYRAGCWLRAIRLWKMDGGVWVTVEEHHATVDGGR